MSFDDELRRMLSPQQKQSDKARAEEETKLTELNKRRVLEESVRTGAFQKIKEYLTLQVIPLLRIIQAEFSKITSYQDISIHSNLDESSERMHDYNPYWVTLSGKFGKTQQFVIAVKGLQDGSIMFNDNIVSNLGNTDCYQRLQNVILKLIESNGHIHDIPPIEYPGDFF